MLKKWSLPTQLETPQTPEGLKRFVSSGTDIDCALFKYSVENHNSLDIPPLSLASFLAVYGCVYQF